MAKLSKLQADSSGGEPAVSISILLQFLRDISGTKESSDGVEEPRSSRSPDGLRAMGMRNF